MEKVENFSDPKEQK